MMITVAGTTAGTAVTATRRMTTCTFCFYKRMNYEVRGVDVISKNNIDYIQVDKGNPDFHLIFRDFPADFCLNCSGAASVPFSFEQPLVDFNLNVFNVVKLLDAIKLYSPECRFVNFSSAAVYGNPKSIPIKEDFPKNPISPYGFHKSVVENIMEEYNKYFKEAVIFNSLFFKSKYIKIVYF